MVKLIPVHERYEAGAWLAIPVCLAVIVAWRVAAHIERNAARRRAGVA